MKCNKQFNKWILEFLNEIASLADDIIKYLTDRYEVF